MKIFWKMKSPIFDYRCVERDEERIIRPHSCLVGFFFLRMLFGGFLVDLFGGLLVDNHYFLYFSNVYNIFFPSHLFYFIIVFFNNKFIFIILTC